MSTYIKSSKEKKDPNVLIENKLNEINNILLTIDKRIANLETIVYDQIKLKDSAKGNESFDLSSESSKFEFLKQVHEQNSGKNSRKKNFIVSYLSCFFVIFIGYGMVYIDETKYPKYLIHITTLSLIVLFYLNMISILFGYFARKEQLIILKIREMVGIKNLFPVYKYNFITYLQSFYLLTSIILQILSFCLMLFSAEQDQNHRCLYIIIFIILAVIIFIFYIYCYRRFKKDISNLAQ